MSVYDFEDADVNIMKSGKGVSFIYLIRQALVENRSTKQVQR